jgi:hypothetical protein
MHDMNKKLIIQIINIKILFKYSTKNENDNR